MNNKLIIILLLLNIAPLLNGKEIYVAKNGSDGNPGTLEAPYLSIVKASTQAFPGDVIYIREGVYEETLQPTRSGNAGNPITYTAYEGEKVVVTALQALSGWTLDEGSVYKTAISWDLGQENMVLNGETACDLARWPNNTDGDPFSLNSLRNTGGSGPDVITDAYLDYASGIPDYDWSRGGSVFFYADGGGAGWTAWKSFIKSSSSNQIVFDLNKNPTWIRTVHYPSRLGDFYLEGIKEAIDYDNEWYFDSNSKTLYLQIPGGLAPQDGQISMRRRRICINLTAKNYIAIRNITAIGGSIEITGSDNYLYGVYSWYGNYSRGVVQGFSSGEESVLLKGSNNTLEKCEISFGTGNGIKFEGSGNKVLNCSVHDFDYLGNYDAPVNMRGGSNSVLKNNTIYRGGRDCVQLFNRNSEIAYNDIYRSNLIADDCGLLYTVGGPYNMEIHHNWLHDTQSRGKLYKAAGIYLDNDAEGFLVHHNVVWNTEWDNIQCNLDCKDLDIYNNTLWDGSAAMGAWHREGTSFTDVKVWNNMADNSQFEPQSDKQNNLTDYGDPFLDKANKNFQLKTQAQAIDYGRVISGITGRYYGSAPDAGAYEYGGETWEAGIDWDPELGPEVCPFPGVRVETDGYVILEASAPKDTTSQYYKVEIRHPGTYGFALHSIGTGSSLLNIQCEEFSNTTFVEMSSKNTDQWTWQTVGTIEDGEPMEILATFSVPGIYEITLAPGAGGDSIKRMALFIPERADLAMDSLAKVSPSACEDIPQDEHWASSRLTSITLTNEGIEIDGLVDEEWQYSDTLRGAFLVTEEIAPQSGDLGFVFSLAYDSDYLYFISLVEDDIRIEMQDHVELFFNPDNLHNLLGVYGDDAFNIRLNLGGTSSPGRGIEYASLENDTGYIIEARIPWTGILAPGINPDPGLMSGFEVQVNDVDEGTGIEHALAWANDTRFNMASVDTRKFGMIVLEEKEIKYVIKSDWEVIYADSEEASGSKEKVIDNQSMTIWQTKWRGGYDPLPHELQIDFKKLLDVKEVHMLPRQDAFGPDGAIGSYELYLSNDKQEWGDPVTSDELSWSENLAENYKELQIISLEKVARGRYMRLVALSEAQNNPDIQVIAIAELDVVTGSYVVGMDHQKHATDQATLYPNPSDGDYVHLTFSREIEAADIRIYAMDGSLIRTDHLDAGREFFLKTAGLPKGVYFVRVAAPSFHTTLQYIRQ